MRHTTAEDLFGRANGALGDSWDTYPNWNSLTIVSQRVRTTVSLADNIETYNAVTLPNDQWAQIEIPTWTGAAYRNVHAFGRVAAPNSENGYSAFVDTNPACGVGEFVAGAFATITYDPFTFNAGSTLRFEVRGTALACVVDGVTVSSASRSTHASGRAGIGSYHEGALTDVEFDNFRAGRFGIRDAGIGRGLGRGVMVGAR